MSTTSAELLYSFRNQAPDVLVRGRACKVSIEVRRSGAVVAPTQSGSTFTLIGPDGTELVSAAAVTVTSSIATYTISAGTLPSTLTLGEGYQERWTLVLGDRTETIDREAALCVRPLYPVVTDLDISGRYSQLAAFRPTADTGWQGKIDLAWREILRRLNREGHASYGVKSPDQLYEAHLQLTMAYIFGDLSLAQRDATAWVEAKKDAQKAYDAAWASVTWHSDDDLDGRVDDPSERRGNAGIVVGGGAPRYSLTSYRVLGV